MLLRRVKRRGKDILARIYDGCAEWYAVIMARIYDACTEMKYHYIINCFKIRRFQC